MWQFCLSNIKRLYVSGFQAFFFSCQPFHVLWKYGSSVHSSWQFFYITMTKLMHGCFLGSLSRRLFKAILVQRLYKMCCKTCCGFLGGSTQSSEGNSWAHGWCGISVFYSALHYVISPHFRTTLSPTHGGHEISRFYGNQGQERPRTKWADQPSHFFLLFIELVVYFIYFYFLKRMYEFKILWRNKCWSSNWNNIYVHIWE